jgi:O-antigen ligase
MAKNWNARLFFIIFSILFAILLCFFYLKYVPLIPTFQIALLPILLLALFLTAFEIEKGTLFFVFAFPLINSLPYFFGIFQHVPHAPTALILFLFYFLGWCIHLCFSQKKPSFNNPIFKPMILFALFILVSGFINFLRFSNFYPFVSDNVYELATNVNGVTAGGALMSTLFHSLSYLTGFAFLFIVLNSVESKKYAKRIIFVLLISLVISLMFGYYQHFKDMSFGNSPFWIHMEQINSTFKGPNPFGTFLAAMVPLIISMICVVKGAWKALFFGIFFATIIIFPHIGTRSAFLGLTVSLVVFFILAVKTLSFPKILDFNFFKKTTARIAALLIIIVVLIVGVISLTQSRLYNRFKNNLNDIITAGNWIRISPERYCLWKEAFYMIKDYPLTGVGVGAYIIELPNYYEKDKNFYQLGLDSSRRIDSAENYFFHAGAELGIGGLLLVIWMIFIIFRYMYKNYRNLPADDKDRYFFIGAAAGVISLFSNLFFHSYIGDFEIKYTFWLLVGLVFVWGSMKKEPKERAYFSRRYKVLSLFFVLFFGGIYLWNCTHSLSLKRRTELFDLKQDFGLYQVETTEDGRKFQWMREYGGMTLKIEKPIIQIPLHVSHPDIEKRPVKVRIYLIKEFFKEQRLLDEITLNNSIWRTYEYLIPEEVGNEVILLVKVSRTWNPQKVLGTPDPRNLGVAVGEIEFKDENSHL